MEKDRRSPVSLDKCVPRLVEKLDKKSADTYKILSSGGKVPPHVALTITTEHFASMRESANN